MLIIHISNLLPFPFTAMMAGISAHILVLNNYMGMYIDVDVKIGWGRLLAISLW